MNLIDRFPHILSMRICTKSQRLYVVVAHDVSKNRELVDYLEQNYLMAYSLVPEGSEGTIPGQAYLVSSLHFGE